MSERVVFHTSLYDRAAVENAASAYAELVSIDVVVTGDDIVATFADVKPEHGDLVDSFCNYALQATIEAGRAEHAGGGAP